MDVGKVGGDPDGLPGQRWGAALDPDDELVGGWIVSGSGSGVHGYDPVGSCDRGEVSVEVYAGPQFLGICCSSSLRPNLPRQQQHQ